MLNATNHEGNANHANQKWLLGVTKHQIWRSIHTYHLISCHCKDGQHTLSFSMPFWSTQWDTRPVFSTHSCFLSMVVNEDHLYLSPLCSLIFPIFYIFLLLFYGTYTPGAPSSLEQDKCSFVGLVHLNTCIPLDWYFGWEKPGGLQPMESQRGGHDWVTNTHRHTHSYK